MDIPALVTLAFVASITPGPNNLMLFASGMNHGIVRSLRHLAGVSLGFAFLIFLVALGLGALFERVAALEPLLKVAGSSYLAFLAWKLFHTSSVRTTEGLVAPLTFIQAAAFQWVNPKAWVMATTATSTLLDTDTSVLAGAAALTSGFWVINLPCIATWLFSGAFAKRWFEDEKRLAVINRTLAILLAATIILLVA